MEFNVFFSGDEGCLRRDLGVDSRELAGEECLEIKGEKNMFFVIPEGFVRCKPNLLRRILKTEKIKQAKLREDWVHTGFEQW